MPPTFKTLAAADIVLVVVLAAAAVGFLPAMNAHAPATVAVFRDNELIARYPLAVDREFTVSVKAGVMVVAIRDRRVRVLASPCPRRLCVDTPPIGRALQQIICAPNHVVVTVEAAGGKEEPDAIAR